VIKRETVTKREGERGRDREKRIIKSREENWQGESGRERRGDRQRRWNRVKCQVEMKENFSNYFLII
jgi:hypothetical protein